MLKERMAGFLLIHGAMHGGWCFDAVAEILRGKGHAVVAPDLPGMPVRFVTRVEDQAALTVSMVDQTMP